MGSHPINLAVRFILELAAWGAMGYWGWTQAEGPLRFVLAIGLPVAAAAIWGTFAVPNDPSRSGRAPVPVPGVVRLGIELVTFGFGAWALYDTGSSTLSLVFAAIVVVHYLVSYDRVAWLIRQPS
jgi:hypothetical protein